MADQKKANVLVPYTVSLPIPRYLESGLYEFQVNLVDFANNMAYMSSSMLRLQWLPSQIEVINTIVDTDPPVLDNFTASTSAVDVTAGSATIEWQMVALDDVSGLQYAYLSMSGPDYYKIPRKSRWTWCQWVAEWRNNSPQCFHFRCPTIGPARTRSKWVCQDATAHYLTPSTWGI
jgi:hypothetical protein